MQRFLITITLLASLALSSCRAVTYFSQGNEHYERGQHEEAITDLETAAELAQAAGNDGLDATIEEELEAVRPP
ncbi:MAG: hypothetical protein OXF54_23090 [Caldilineaceae bacterium]|nr:hypothetical protein [Caldilineaceae bacterium]